MKKPTRKDKKKKKRDYKQSVDYVQSASISSRRTSTWTQQESLEWSEPESSTLTRQGSLGESE